MAHPDWESEFADFFHANALRLRRVAWSICGDWAQAEDIVQTAFVRLYPKFKAVRRGDPLAYTRRIVVNLCLSRVRRPRREVLTSDVPEVADRERASHEALDLAAALRSLPLQQSAVVSLRFLEDLSVREVGEILGISEGTVKSHTSRALAALRQDLSESSWIEERR